MSGTVVYLPRPVLSPELRARCEQTIEWLLALLDAMDTPDADLEPSLAAPELRMTETVVIDGRWTTRHVSQDEWALSGDTGDREGDLADSTDDREGGDPLDAGEETLGWCENVGQRRLGENCADGDNTAPERHGGGFTRCGADDYEPSLGASNPMVVSAGSDGRAGLQFVSRVACDQTAWGSISTTDDREGDPAESGIGDSGGLDEQVGSYWLAGSWQRGRPDSPLAWVIRMCDNRKWLSEISS